MLRYGRAGAACRAARAPRIRGTTIQKKPVCIDPARRTNHVGEGAFACDPFGVRARPYQEQYTRRSRHKAPKRSEDFQYDDSERLSARRKLCAPDD